MENPEDRHIIYGLIDPNTNNLRYIGFTSNKTLRYHKHHNVKYLGGNSHKANWIKSLLKNKQKAEIIIIDEHENAEDLPESETFWYQYFKMLGADLTNDSYYIGYGKIKGSPSPNKGKKFSLNHRENLSKSHIGIYDGENHPMFGKKHSKESVEKISNSLKGRLPNSGSFKKGQTSPNKGKFASLETKLKLSLANSGKKWKIVNEVRTYYK